MTAHTSLWKRTLALLAACGGLFGAFGCCDDEPEHPRPAQTQGGEDPSVLDRAEKDVDQGVRDVQKAVDPAAELVDEKAKQAVREGEQAVEDVTGGAAAADLT